jgi:hypothetical protein
MDYYTDKVDEVVLALTWLVMHEDGPVTRVWKGFGWDALDRLHEKGLISNPKSRAKCIVVWDEAIELSEALFKKYFGKSG